MASPASPGTPGLVEGQGPHVPLPTPSLHYTRGGPTPPDCRNSRRGRPRHVPNTGADDRDRTGDLVLTKDVLCQLSYIGLTSSVGGLRPAKPPDAFARGAPTPHSAHAAHSPPLVRAGLPIRAPNGAPAGAERGVRGPASDCARGSGGTKSPGRSWSGRRGSNPRPTAWKAVTLPLSYSRLRLASSGHPPPLDSGGRARRP
jgi:hypothetical protein